MKVEKITPSNRRLLVQVRQKVNHNEGKSEKKLMEEASQYAMGDDRRAIIVCNEGKPVGYVLIIIAGAIPERLPDASGFSGYAHISKIGVITKSRRKHVGSALLMQAEALAKVRKAKGVWLDYSPGEPGLEKFYEAAGYQRIFDFDDDKNGKISRHRIAVKLL